MIRYKKVTKTIATHQPFHCYTYKKYPQIKRQCKYLSLKIKPYPMQHVFYCPSLLLSRRSMESNDSIASSFGLNINSPKIFLYVQSVVPFLES